jgi:CRP-like cAMP-binding protein
MGTTRAKSLALTWLPEDIRRSARTRQFKAGDIIFSKGDPSQGLFVVLEGRVKVFSYSTNGAVVLHYFAHAGEMFAEAALFSPTYECDALAEDLSRVAVVSTALGRKAIQGDKEFAERLLNMLALRVHYFRSLLEVRRIRSAEERVLEYAKLLQSTRPAVVAPRNGRELAESVGLDPASLYRALAQLRRKGLLQGSDLPGAASPVLPAARGG